MPGTPGLTFEQRLWSWIDRSGGPAACWEWTGHVNRGGYGTLGRGRRDEKDVLAHRAAYEVTIGPIPAGLFVCHSCDNRRCCNPAHLFLGTNTDNMRDAERKGRVKNAAMVGKLHVIPRGDNHWSRKPGAPKATGDKTKPRLAAFVSEIRASSEPTAILAQRYQTSPNSIRAIRSYRAYAHGERAAAS